MEYILGNFCQRYFFLRHFWYLGSRSLQLYSLSGAHHYTPYHSIILRIDHTLLKVATPSRPPTIFNLYQKKDDFKTELDAESDGGSKRKKLEAVFSQNSIERAGVDELKNIPTQISQIPWKCYIWDQNQNAAQIHRFGDFGVHLFYHLIGLCISSKKYSEECTANSKNLNILNDEATRREKSGPGRYIAGERVTPYTPEPSKPARCLCTHCEFALGGWPITPLG